MTSDGNQLCLTSEVRKPGQHTKVAERRGTWDEHATKETWTPNHQTKADYASSKLQLLHKTVQGQTRAILQGKVLEWLLQRANWILPEHQYRKPGSQTWKSIGPAVHGISRHLTSRGGSLVAGTGWYLYILDLGALGSKPGMHCGKLACIKSLFLSHPQIIPYFQVIMNHMSQKNGGSIFHWLQFSWNDITWH